MIQTNIETRGEQITGVRDDTKKVGEIIASPAYQQFIALRNK